MPRLGQVESGALRRRVREPVRPLAGAVGIDAGIAARWGAAAAAGAAPSVRYALAAAAALVVVLKLAAIPLDRAFPALGDPTRSA